MKKIFYGIGILLAIFSIYFFLLYADKQVYVNDSCLYDVVLHKAISGDELEQYAKNSNIMIQILDHKNVSFGKNDIEVVVINPEKEIKCGRQCSIFPKSDIVFVTNPTLSELVVESFAIQTRDQKKVDVFCDELENAGYSSDVLCSGELGFSFVMLFNKLNLKFFLMIFIVTVLSIIMYYIYRLKEIGILSLNGWSANKVSVQIMTTMIYTTICTSLVLVIPFVIYIAILDGDLLDEFLLIYLSVVCFLSVVYIVAAVVATFFISRTNKVKAIKSGRNNQLIFYALIFAKLLTTFLVFGEVCEVKNHAINLYHTNLSIEGVEEQDLYTITTMVSNLADMEKISKVISTFSDENVFNFGYDMSQNVYMASDLKGQLKRTETPGEYDNVLYISDNLVSYLHIREAHGNLIGDIDVKENEVYYLIPKWMQEYEEQLRQNLLIEAEDKIVYIENDQVYNDLVCPDLFLYDCIIRVSSPAKTLFTDYGGDVFLSKDAAQLFNEEIKELGLSEHVVEAVSSEMDNDLCISNLKLELFESLFYLVVMLISYSITNISIILIYFEFKKKHFGVYALIGKMPIGIICRFGSLMGIIVGICAFVTDVSLLLIVLLEWLFYIMMSYWYIKKKAINVLKGA